MLGITCKIIKLYLGPSLFVGIVHFMFSCLKRVKACFLKRTVQQTANTYGYYVFPKFQNKDPEPKSKLCIQVSHNVTVESCSNLF